MGKDRRQRKKLHLSASPANTIVNKVEKSTTECTSRKLPLPAMSDNIFAGLNINVDKLNVKLAEPIKEGPPVKCNTNESKDLLKKKDKLKLRRELFLKKMDQLNQVKKLRKNNKKKAIIGDTNALLKALPSLESLVKLSCSNKGKSPNATKKKKGIEKASKRLKSQLHGVNIIKQTLKNKSFQSNPFETITNHLKKVVEKERQLTSSKMN